MADTVTFILNFLEKQNLSKAAEALRDEIKHKEQVSPGSPRVQPTANDLDVDLILRLSQGGAHSSRLTSASSTGSQDSATPPPQHSPSSLLPETQFSEGDKAPALSLPAKLGSGSGAKQSDGTNARVSGGEAVGSIDVQGTKATAMQGNEEPPEGGASTPTKRAPLPPLPVADPVASSCPELTDLPHLRPVRLSAATRSPSTGSTKLQPLPEVGEDEGEEGEEDDEADEEEEEEEEEDDDDDDEEEEEDDEEDEEECEEEENDDEDAEEGEEEEGAEAEAGSSAQGKAVKNPVPADKLAADGEKAMGKEEKQQRKKALSPSSEHAAIGVLPLGSVVVDSQVLNPAESAGIGVRKPRGSVSQMAADQEDSQSVFSLSTDGAVAASEAQDSAWDSDTYDDEDDPGYTRQPIEDEEWFLLHEIEYPTEEDPHRQEQEALLAIQAAQTQKAAPETGAASDASGAKANSEATKQVEAKVTETKAEEKEKEKEKVKEKADSSKGGDVKAGLIPEEEVYFSGEEYYQQPVEGELGLEGERLPEDVNGEGTWAGVMGEYSEGKGRSPAAKGKKSRHAAGSTKADGVEGHERQGEGDHEEQEEDEDEQLLYEARSVGISDIADAGSSIRESVQGSDGDGDSVKGVPLGVGGKSRLGRVGDEAEMEEGEDVEEGSEAGGGEDGDEDEDTEGGAAEGDGGTGGAEVTDDAAKKAAALKVRRKKAGLSLIERAGKDKRKPEFGFRSFSEAVGEAPGEGLGGGFSFPSPSSQDGLSRMNSGRSMSGDAVADKGFADLAVGEELDTLASAADDTLAAWKRHSASSSPMLLSPKKSDDGKSPTGSEQSETLHTHGHEKGQAERSRKAEEAPKKPKEKVEEKAAPAAAVPAASGASGPSVAAAPPAAEKAVGPEMSKRPAVPNLELKGGQGAGAAAAAAGAPAAPAVADAATPSAAVAGGGAKAGESKKEEGGKKEEKSAGVGGKDSKSSSSTKTGAESEEFETFSLKIIHRKNRTGFEEEKDFPVVLSSVIAGRYYVTEYLGSAAFSKAIQAHDLYTGMDVCLKIIKNNKDFFDQSLDEIKLLKFVNRHDPADEHHVLRLFDYFYHREHLFIITELLRANLYEFQKYNRDSGGEVYFTMQRLQRIARQVLQALKFMHSLGLIHCDLKPENILIKSYSRCEVKVIDLGSSCFETDHLCTYVQSRSYRAPEVILGLPYGPRIDIWSLGCILAELCSGQVLFQNDSLATLLARVVGIIGPIDPQLLRRGRERHKFFTRSHMLYERNPETEQLEYLIPKRTTLRHRVPMGDPGFIDFVSQLLTVDPEKRPTAAEALNHPWLKHQYEATP